MGKTAETLKLNVLLTAFGEIPQNIPVSLYNGNTLMAKSAVDFSDSNQSTLTFDIDKNTTFTGKLELNDASLTFDNTLYFSIDKPKKIKVLSINDTNANYLQRMFDQPEFEYTQVALSSLNYNTIPDQNFVILNELKDIPASLTTALKSFSDAGGSLLVIPSEAVNLTTYTTLLRSFGIGSISEAVLQEKQITKIIFDHPLFKDVFEKEVANFQYPKVNSFYNFNTTSTSALQFEDGKPFLLQQGNTYVTTAAINSENSNFQNSPLIVPTLYNIALQSLQLPKLYYHIGSQNTFSIPVKLKQNEILTMKDSTSKFIPLQQTKANKVDITTTDEPSQAGIYQIVKEETFIEYCSFNYTRDESTLQYAAADAWDGVTLHDSVATLFESINEANSINSFWKWFVIFALLFLVLEMLILKFYK